MTNNLENLGPQLKSAVADKASVCVKCGLCLPHCPTYQLTKNENESPRGRIELLHALATDKLPLSSKVEQHLDNCLACRACERVCPAHVEYGPLITQGRSLNRNLPQNQSKPQPLKQKLFASIVKAPRGLIKTLHWMLWCLEITKLRAIANKLKITNILGLKPLEEFLPPIKFPRKLLTEYPAQNTQIAKIGLFTGCLTPWIDQKSLHASIYVLTKLGYHVTIPRNQTCCGAIDLHNGNFSKGKNLAEQNTVAFDLDIDYVVSLASGCSCVLTEYPQELKLNEETSAPKLNAFAKKNINIYSLIKQTNWPDELKLNNLNYKHVALHTPCTMRNALRTPDDVAAVFTKLPELKFTSLKNPYCCGAAGTNMLSNPGKATAFIKPFLQEIDSNQANIVCTSNIGCALHFKNQLQAQNPGTKVIEPIILIAEAMGFK